MFPYIYSVKIILGDNSSLKNTNFVFLRFAGINCTILQSQIEFYHRMLLER